MVPVALPAFPDVTLPPQPSDPSSKVRPPLRPPIGIPQRDESRRVGTALSVLLHALVVVLVLSPPLFLARSLDFQQKRGAGGAGPAGGGGGGAGAAAPVRERLRFVQIIPAAPVALRSAPVPTPVPPPPAPPSKPDPVKPPPPAPPAAAAAPVPSAPSPASGEGAAGAGAGKDAGAGTGSGSGGGTGSGVGTGKGSGVGPGTGGGEDNGYPPAVVALPILPLPVPGKVRPYKLVAYFEVDTAGRARLLAFNPSNDGSYNKRIRDMLNEIRFRPGTRPDGRPVIDTAIVTAEARL